jgi:ribosomal protein S18 acetylase RimI-like enzyme
MNEKRPGKKIIPGIYGPAVSGLRWQKMRKQEDAAALLRSRELRYVAACGRFLKREPPKDKVWTLRDKAGGIHALIVYSKRNLLPVFCDQKEIPPPRFLKGIFGVIPVHSVQGLRDEAIFLEASLEKLGLEAVEKIDYDLMRIDRLPNESGFSAGPAGLILREPRHIDMDALTVLQAGYEQEEVLPKGADFNPAVSRLNTEKIFSGEQILTAELGGRLVGKINTSAVSFSRFQIGGVYVHPDYRGLGIARRMTAEFVRSLITHGRGINLFVKKSNFAAISVYRRLGFEFLADYRISYYG